MTFIDWCNQNNGFLSAILSAIGLFLSFIAIVVSIHTARLPYKKKLLIRSSLDIGISGIPGISVNYAVVGITASAANVGNRTISLTYLGYAIKKDGRFCKLHPMNRDFNCKACIKTSEMFQVEFQREELYNYLKNENNNTKLYVYANDTEGTVYKNKIGTVGDLLRNLCQ